MSSAEIWSITRRWLWLAVLGIVLGVGVAVAVSTVLPRTYTATAKLLVTSGDSGVLTGGGNLEPSQIVATYAQVLQSRPVVDAAFRDAGVVVPYESAVRFLDVAPLRGTQ